MGNEIASYIGSTTSAEGKSSMLSVAVTDLTPKPLPTKRALRASRSATQTTLASADARSAGRWQSTTMDPAPRTPTSKRRCAVKKHLEDELASAADTGAEGS
jgi:hypothetical protein